MEQQEHLVSVTFAWLFFQISSFSASEGSHMFGINIHLGYM